MLPTSLDHIRDTLARYFDFLPEDALEYGGMRYELAARSNIRNEAYLLFKSAVMYAFENNEFCLVKVASALDHEFLNQLEISLLEAGRRHVMPDESHMSTFITAVVIAPGPAAPDLKKRVERFRKQQSHRFGFNGWTSYRIVLIETSNQQVTASREAHKLAKFLKSAKDLEPARV